MREARCARNANFEHIRRDGITAGVATLERVVAQRYDWRDAGLGPARKRRRGGLFRDEEEDAREKQAKSDGDRRHRAATAKRTRTTDGVGNGVICGATKDRGDDGSGKGARPTPPPTHAAHRPHPHY